MHKKASACKFHIESHKSNTILPGPQTVEPKLASQYSHIDNLSAYPPGYELIDKIKYSNKGYLLREIILKLAYKAKIS